MSPNAESEAQVERYLAGRTGLTEVLSPEVPAESVGTVGAVQSWRQRIPNFT